MGRRVGQCVEDPAWIEEGLAGVAAVVDGRQHPGQGVGRCGQERLCVLGLAAGENESGAQAAPRAVVQGIKVSGDGALRGFGRDLAPLPILHEEAEDGVDLLDPAEKPGPAELVTGRVEGLELAQQLGEPLSVVDDVLETGGVEGAEDGHG